MSKTNSQNTLIKQHLEDGNTITPIDALNLFGCFRLSARIKNLRDQGMDIVTNRITKGGKTFASYEVA